MRHRFSACFYLFLRLILDRVRDKDGFKLRPSQVARLRPRRRRKDIGCDRHCGYAKVLELYCVVQTARCARSSIRKRLYNGVDPFVNQLVDQTRWCGLCKGWLHCSNDSRNTVSVPQDLFEAIEKDAAARLADIEKPDRSTFQRFEPGGW
jgi:hypothetical protein